MAFDQTPWSKANATQQVRYGIESYFVPEGQGKRLEDLAREKRMAALIAVDSARQRRHQGHHHRRQAAVRGAAFLKWRARRPVL